MKGARTDEQAVASIAPSSRPGAPWRRLMSTIRHKQNILAHQTLQPHSWSFTTLYSSAFAKAGAVENVYRHQLPYPNYSNFVSCALAHTVDHVNLPRLN